MTFEVLLVESAERDLEELYDYVAESDGEGAAADLLDRFVEAFESLEELPRHGRIPPELADLGLNEFREIRFKPYRIIYTLEDEIVFVHVISDGRRDMRSLLTRRLLRAL